MQQLSKVWTIKAKYWSTSEHSCRIYEMMEFIGGGTDAVLIFGKTWKWIEFCEWHGEEEKSDRRLMELESNFASAAEVDLLQSSLVLLWSLVYAELEFWSCLKASSFHDVSWESDLSSSKVFQLVAFAVWEQSDSDHGDKVMNWFLHLIFQLTPAPSFFWEQVDPTIAFPFFQLSGKHSLLLKIWRCSAMLWKKSIQNGFHCLIFFPKRPKIETLKSRWLIHASYVG